MGIESISTVESEERAIVVGVATPQVTKKAAEAHLDELASLANTAGANVIERFLQMRPHVDSSTIVGSGKLKEIARKVETLKANLILFDEDLTASQVKKIESIVPVKVLDRSGIILDIFARNARTSESKIQVEVAQLEYYLPRLTRAWTHLSRQVGGIGTRGPGETQLEVDRRLVRNRINQLKKKLSKQLLIRKSQHQNRMPTYHVALVGYTNTGKSSLMNVLTDAKVEVANKLFATLDATTRKIFLGHGAPSVLSDTVGFIRKLPHHLVESFKSTLGVVQESNLIIHVVDAGDEDFLDHMEVTADVLNDLDTQEIPRITVFNKTDTVDETRLNYLQGEFPDAIFISVVADEGIEKLRQKIQVHYSSHSNVLKKQKRIAPTEW